MLRVLVLLCLWPAGIVKSEDVNQGWDRLVVGFPKFIKMPIRQRDAENAGWIKDGSCEENNVYVGNRYIKDKDKSTRLIFGDDGMVAGIQTTLPLTATGQSPPSTSPWIRVNENEAIVTAYFRNPETICRRNGGNSAENKFSFGHELYIQTKSCWEGGKNAIRIPKNEDELKQKYPAWVKGKCFPGMGLHYWYNVSPNLKCEDIFPVFLLYDNESGKLMSFGWSLPTLVTSPLWEHPPPKYLSFFFNKNDIPKCLMNETQFTSTQHVYLRDPKRMACLK